MTEGTSIDMGDGFGGMSLLSGGAGFVGGLVLGSLWNGNGPWGGRGNAGRPGAVSGREYPRPGAD